MGLSRIPVALPVDSEAGVVQTLDQEVPPLVSVKSPWLDRQWLVLVVVVSLLLVLVLEHARDNFGGGKGPEDEGSEQVELMICQYASILKMIQDVPSLVVSCC